MNMPPEPTIIINGQTLTQGEAMTVRVALCAFISDMNKPNALGDDETGKAIAAGYVRNGQSVFKIMST